MFTSLALATLLFFSAHNAAGFPFGQNPHSKTATGANSARSAKDVAQGFDAHYRRTTTMAGFFLEKYTSGGSGMVAESGKVYFEKPGRMRWDYDSPETKMFLVDGKNVWYYVPADHTASRTSIKESSDWRTPLALLAGKVNLERLCGSLTLGGSAAQSNAGEKVSEAGDAVLVCGPRKPDEDMFREVLLEINSRDQLVRLDIRQPGDIETEFRFGDWHENVAIEPSKFHFEPPRGVAIVDDASLAIKVQ
ncbi:MAG: outer membrane lipoprotein carrier protein LolA [Candidatus Acidiferrales bacterium]